MNYNELYNAFSGIDEKYISRSEKFSDISLEFKREKSKRAGILSSVCGGSVIVAAALCLIGNGIFDEKPNFTHKRSDVRFVADTTAVNVEENPTNASYTNVVSAVTDVKKSQNNESNEETEKNSAVEYTEETYVSSGDTYENDEVSDVPYISDSEPDNPIHDPDTKDHDEVKKSPVSEKYYFKAFAETTDSYSDDYGTDAPHSAELILFGSKYIQLELSEYPEHNISDIISESDFGEFIGTISEITDTSTDYQIASKEPDLAGAEVYYYAAAGSSSVIIVKKAEQCSIFVLQDTITDPIEINPVPEILFQLPTEAENAYGMVE